MSKSTQTECLRSGCFFVTGDRQWCIYYGRREEAGHMFRGSGSGLILGLFAVALGAGILIAAIFPVGARLFLVAFVLIACGCACCRRH